MHRYPGSVNLNSVGTVQNSGKDAQEGFSWYMSGGEVGSFNALWGDGE